MRLFNLNIGIKIDNIKGVIELIRDSKADIVCLQEVLRPLDKGVKPKYQNKAMIDRVLSKIYPYSFFGPVWVSDDHRRHGRSHRPFGGFIEQGNYIMSKFPIVRAYNSVYYGNYSYDYDWSNWHKDDHARAVVVADIVIKKGKILRVLNNHGNYSKEKIDTSRSLKECQHIKQQALLHKGPVIIAGDFNLHPQTKSIKVLNKVFANLISKYKLESTLPINVESVPQLKNVIDYIFVNKQVIVKDFRAIKSSISDHYPLVLDFKLR